MKKKNASKQMGHAQGQPTGGTSKKVPGGERQTSVDPELAGPGFVTRPQDYKEIEPPPEAPRYPLLGPLPSVFDPGEAKISGIGAAPAPPDLASDLAAFQQEYHARQQTLSAANAPFVQSLADALEGRR